MLLLDEPLSALDRRLRQEMQIELRRIQRESGLTTIFVTHDQEEALTLSDGVAILDRGRIVQEGRPAEIYERPRTRFAASFLGDANFFTGIVSRGGVAAPGGAIRTRDTLPANGRPVTVAVRPEKIALCPPGQAPEGANSMAATVRAVIYAGAVSTYILEGPDGAELKVLAQNREAAPAEPGSRVTLAWSPAHSVVVED